MIAFHGKQDLKDKLLVEIEKHRLADQIVSGTYGKFDDNGKWHGCAVACSIKSYNNIYGKDFSTSDHGLYEELFGIHKFIARLQDIIFEGLSSELKVVFPEQFISAINVGADLSKVWDKFAVWLLVDKEHGVINYAKTNELKYGINNVANLFINGGTKEEFRLAATAAYKAAADASYDSAFAAAKDSSYAAAFAADATKAAAYAAAFATGAAARYAYAADSSYYAGRKKAFKHQAEKLIELLKEAK